ncbi:roquin-1 isoform X1 [Hydra vulgaris]|uniref:roquin-1 isoform X1 n=1 Tax=Hydra vulgaris TaxID=6087 RepID=UPI001F5FD5C7|nr:roquin-1 [Hydra vulgaris]
MPIQAPQWTDFKLCPVCQNEFKSGLKPPISLGCGHSICKSCLLRLSKQQCPFDQAEIKNDITKLPVNYALLSLCGGTIPDYFEVEIPELIINRKEFDAARIAIETLAECLQNIVITSSNCNYTSGNGILTRPMQRKIVSILHCQLAEVEGQSRAMRAARSIGERAVKELILMHQSPQTLSTALWAAVRQRGCQFLGPAMQEAVLRLILLSLEDGISLSRKVLVLFVVQRLEKQFTQASKTSIGHVVQLLYRASCFKVTKRDGDSSLLQLHEKYQTYSALRKEHDAQIVQIAMEAGLHISPEQWSALLYGDDDHKSHMQSIIDKLQTPASFSSSIQELIIALQRTDDPHNLQDLQIHLEKLASIDPNPEAEPPLWKDIEECMTSLLVVVSGLRIFAKDYASKNKGNIEGTQMINTKYRTSMCRDIIQKNTCPRGANCNFAHSEEELERYRKRRNVPAGRVSTGVNGYHQGSRANSNSSPDSCENDLEDEFDEINLNQSSPNLSKSQQVQYRTQVTSIDASNGSPFSPICSISKIDEGRDLVNMSASFESQPVSIRSSPSLYHSVAYVSQQQPQQQHFYDVREHQIHPTIYLQNNQTSFLSNPTMFQQQTAIPQIQACNPIYQYQQDYMQYPGMFSQPFAAHNFTTRTALARGGVSGSSSTLLNTDSELSLNISSLKDSKEEWKLGGKSRIDSFIDSGRGSSLGYSSDTCSPRSSGSSSMSQTSPQSNEKIWGDSLIWAAPSIDSIKKSNTSWSWKELKDCRGSDSEDRNLSSESLGKKYDIDDKKYSMMKEWSGDLNNNRSNPQGLLGLLSGPTTAVRPPPGFKLLSDD